MRLAEPAQIAGRDVQLEQSVSGVGVVGEVPRPFRDAVAPGAVQPAVAVRERTEQEVAEPRRGREPVRPADRAGARGERCEHQAVPRRDRLVVTQRLRPLLPNREEPLPRLVVELAADDEPPMLERLEQLVGRALVRRPGEREALDPVRVGILRRGEAAAVERQLPQHVVDRLLRDAPVPIVG